MKSITFTLNINIHCKLYIDEAVVKSFVWVNYRIFDVFIWNVCMWQNVDSHCTEDAMFIFFITTAPPYVIYVMLFITFNPCYINIHIQKVYWTVLLCEQKKKKKKEKKYWNFVILNTDYCPLLVHRDICHKYAQNVCTAWLSSVISWV